MPHDMLNQIVYAVVVNDGKMLLGLKKEGPHPAGIGGEWTIPGGTVEEDAGDDITDLKWVPLGNAIRSIGPNFLKIVPPELWKYL